MTVELKKMTTENVIVFDFEDPGDLPLDMHHALHQAQAHMNTDSETLYVVIDLTKLEDVSEEEINTAMQQILEQGHGWYLGAPGTEAIVLCDSKHLSSCRDHFSQQSDQSLNWYTSIEDAMQQIRG